MYSPYPLRLDTPPPQSHFRRPWSPQELEPSSTHRTRYERQETSDSYEALDLADYATTLHRTNVQSSFREPGPYPPFSSMEHRYPEYPATPPRSFSLASHNSYPSPPSLVSAGSSSAQTHSRSMRSHTPAHRPFSLPTPTPHYPYTPPGSNYGHSHNYPRIFEAQSPVLTPVDPQVDLSAFPEWSREWYDRPKSQMPGGFDPHGPISPYDMDSSSRSHNGLLGFPSKTHSLANDSHRSLLPWSAEDDISHSHVTSEMKEERLRMLENEFGHNVGASDVDQAKVIGSVDAKGHIITDGPKKRLITRCVQFLFVLGTIIASFYSALILKPEGTPPPKGTIPAYLLYALSVISLLAILVVFVFAPCCCAGKRRQKMVQEGPAGMMVLPIQGLPGSAPKKGKKKGKGKNSKHDHSNEGVQVNLIVDPSAFGIGSSRQEDSEQEEEGSTRQRPQGKRKGLFEGLAMEHQWKLARKHLRQIMFFDIIMFFLWGAEFIVILMGKRCPVGAFEGWCDGYNVATALAAFLVVAYGLSIFFDIKDIHASRASPRTRT